MSDVLLLQLLRRFAAAMGRSFDLHDVLHELSVAATQVLDASGAGVSVATRDHRLEFVAATDASVIDVEQVQQRCQSGPCVEAFTTGKPVPVDDLNGEDRWPELARAAQRIGFRSIVGLPLWVEDHRLGSINVYDRRPRGWSGEDLEAAQVLADVATAYLLRVGELAEFRHLAHQLQSALDSRVVIEQAKGMLSRDHGVGVDEAFERLRAHCRSSHLRLHDVARAVVNGELTLPPARPDAAAGSQLNPR